MSHRILVAGIGNIFLGDDAFGSEVARVLAHRSLPSEVKVVDFGIRGLDLAYALLDPWEATILIDATPRGGKPGTIYTIEPDFDRTSGPGQETPMLDPHGMDPMKVLQMVRALRGEPKKIILVGCEPESLGGDEGFMGLSPAVQEAAGRAVDIVEALVSEILSGECKTCSVGTGAGD